MAYQIENVNNETRQFDRAYSEALKLAENHYENFPVISYFLPKKLKKYVAVIYQFARAADDFADEGDHSPEKRLELLNEYEQDFINSENGIFKNEFWKILNDTILVNDLSRQHFLNLIKAFKQDVIKNRYSNFEELLDYCSNSANPVGRIMLELFDIRDADSLKYSDDICTALQLTNFYQDVSIDILKGRIYLPLDEMKHFNVSESIIGVNEYSYDFGKFMKFQVERAEKMFGDGENLIVRLRGKFRFQIKMTISGGRSILKKIENNNYNVQAIRPVLLKKDYLYLFLRRMDQAKKIAKKSKSNFYYAFTLLPEEQRDAMNTVYAFCRKTDDIVDENDNPMDVKSENLLKWNNEFEKALSGSSDFSLLNKLVTIIHKFNIPVEPFFDLIKGMEMDLKRDRYLSFDDLIQYCYRVASTVGLMSIEIFGYKNKSAKDYAVNLGLAMQLTNILRDVKADADNGRIYLPQEDLENFGYSENDLLNGVYNNNFIALMEFESARAKKYFNIANHYLTFEDKPSMFAARAMQHIYFKLLRKLETEKFRVFEKRINVSKSEKVFISLGVWAKYNLVY
jgi:phytoene synthase